MAPSMSCSVDGNDFIAFGKCGPLPSFRFLCLHKVKSLIEKWIIIHRIMFILTPVLTMESQHIQGLFDPSVNHIWTECWSPNLMTGLTLWCGWSQGGICWTGSNSFMGVSECRVQLVCSSLPVLLPSPHVVVARGLPGSNPAPGNSPLLSSCQWLGWDLVLSWSLWFCGYFGWKWFAIIFCSDILSMTDNWQKDVPLEKTDDW